MVTTVTFGSLEIGDGFEIMDSYFLRGIKISKNTVFGLTGTTVKDVALKIYPISYTTPVIKLGRVAIGLQKGVESSFYLY